MKHRKRHSLRWHAMWTLIGARSIRQSGAPK